MCSFEPHGKHLKFSELESMSRVENAPVSNRPSDSGRGNQISRRYSVEDRVLASLEIHFKCWQACSSGRRLRYLDRARRRLRGETVPLPICWNTPLAESSRLSWPSLESLTPSEKFGVPRRTRKCYSLSSTSLCLCLCLQRKEVCISRPTSSLLAYCILVATAR